MDKIVEYRSQELMCRQRAQFDLLHAHHWMGQAEMWWHKTQDEISSHFEACNTAGAKEPAQADAANANAERLTAGR